jgi:regulator-associated protein of mTOR
MSDGSPIVRKEFVIALSHIVHQSGHAKFVAAATQPVEEETAQRAAGHLDERAKIGRSRNVDRRQAMDGMFSSTSHDSVYAVIWKALLNLSVDPHPGVAEAAQTVVDYVNSKLLNNNATVSDYASSLIHKATASVVSNPHLLPDRSQSFTIHEDKSSAAALRRPAKLTRSASFAQTLRSLYNLGSGTLSGTSGSDTSSVGTTPPSSNVLTNGSQNGGSNGLLAKAASVSSGIEQQQPLQQQMNSMEKDRRQGFQQDQDILPLKSDFYEWSCEYFTEPQMRAAEADEPGSVSYTQRKWRRSRNEKILDEAQSMCQVAGNENQLLFMHF